MPRRVPTSIGPRRALCAASLLLVLASPLSAQQGAAPADTAPPRVPADGFVVFRRDTLFQLHGTIGPFSPEERAQAVQRRIRRIAEDPLLTADRIVVADTMGAVDVRLDSLVILTVTERDAAEAGMGRKELADQYAERIRAVVQGRQGAANLKTILVGAVLTLLTLAAFIAILILLNRAFPLLYRFIERGRGRWIRSLRIQRLEILPAAQATDALLFAARVARVAAFIFVVYVFLPIVFSFFPWTRGLANTIFNWTLTPLASVWQAFTSYLPNLFTIAVIAVVFYYLLKFIRLLFTGIERGAIALPGFYGDWALPTYKIVRFLVIVFAAVVIFPYLPGAKTDAFKGISIFLGVLVSFGSSAAIANVVAGVVMTYMRPFQIGDRVRIADTEGDVIERTLLVTRVRTPKHVEITIPNAMVLASHITNFSAAAADGGVILHTTVTIGYDTPWRQVHELLLAAAARTKGLLTKPAPFVLQTALNDFHVSYQLNAYCDHPSAMPALYSEMHANIQDEFQRAGVQIMSPNYEADPEAPKIPRAFRSPASGQA